MITEISTHEDVLAFWFSEDVKPHWWAKSDAFDMRMKDLFLPILDDESRMAAWPRDAHGLMARIIVTDQAPRNIFRNDPKSFAWDETARALCRELLDADLDMQLEKDMRGFAYLPLEHSESLEDQKECLRLMQERIGDENMIDFARKHLVIIEQFGRFPHRNAVLGRDSSPEEQAFLQQPGSSF